MKNKRFKFVHFLTVFTLLICFTLIFGILPARAVDSFDFGDAPDPTYPSLLASNGARHAPPTNFYFGPNVNSEWDSLQVNNDAFDDGLLFRSPITYLVTNLGGTTIYANILVDYNRDGDWTDPGEWIEQNRNVTGPGVITGSIYYVWKSLPDNTWMRMTLTSTQLIAYDGSSPEPFIRGETEDYIFNAPPDDGCMECHVPPTPPAPPDTPLPPPGPRPQLPDRPTKLSGICFNGGTTGITVHWVDLTYEAGGGTTLSVHFGYELHCPIVVAPGATVCRQVPPGTPWPDDIHISYQKDGVNKSASFGPPLDPGIWYPLNSPGVMLMAVKPVPATSIWAIAALGLAGLLILAIGVIRKRKRG